MKKDFVEKIDCIDGMKKLADGSISSIITDPPYNYEFIGKDWNHQEIQRRTKRVSKDSKTLVKNIPYGSGLAGGVRNKRWYERNRQNVFDYQDWCLDWGREAFRVMKDGAYVCVFNSTRTIAHVQIALEEAGFYSRDIIVWRRHSGIPKGLNVEKKLEKMGHPDPSSWKGWHSALRTEWEAILLAQKPLINNYINTLEKTGVGLMKTINEDGSFQSNIIENVIREKVDEYNTHCTVKPIDLINKLVNLVTPSGSEHIVLDPFMGSGTTAVAAINNGNSYIGYERVAENVDIANKRIKKRLNEESKLLANKGSQKASSEFNLV